MILGEGKSLPMELGGESLWTHLGIGVEKIDPSSSEDEAHKRHRSSKSCEL